MSSESTIKLGLAERAITNTILAQNTAGDVTTARLVRTLRRGLDLRAAQTEIDELIEAAKAGGRAVMYDDLMAVDAEDAPKSYDVSSEALRWLQDRLGKATFGKAKDKDGKDVEVPVAADMLEVFANLADALGDALA
jgi:hypothetical protein